MKLPCSHFIRNLLENNEEFNMSHVDKQWHLGISSENVFQEENMFEYVRNATLSRPRGRQRESERTSLENNPSFVRRCRVYGRTGHNSRTCSATSPTENHE
jgi:hypothetical protein